VNNLREITLIPEAAKRPGDPRWPAVTRIRVVRETPEEWLGLPVDNPACPELQYPKFAWKEIQRG